MADLDLTDHAHAERRADPLSDEDIAVVIGDYDEMIEREDGRTEYSRVLEGVCEVTVLDGVDGP